MNSGWLKPRGFTPQDRYHISSEEEVLRPIRIPPRFGDGMSMEHEVTGGRPAQARRLRRQLVVDGERTYHSYSADELLEIESQAFHARRPGQAY